MLEAAHPRPEEVVEFSSHVDVKQRARSLLRFKSGEAPLWLMGCIFFSNKMGTNVTLKAPAKVGRSLSSCFDRSGKGTRCI